MINMYEVSETNKMIEHENLDVRTITLGISLLDCIDSDVERIEPQRFMKKLQSTAEKTWCQQEMILRREFGIPIVNKTNFCYPDCSGRRCCMQVLRKIL